MEGEEYETQILYCPVDGEHVYKRYKKQGRENVLIKL